MNIDDLLNSSTPPVAMRTPEFKDELRRTVTVSGARRARGRRRLSAGSIAFVAVLVSTGGYAAAAAGGLVGAPFGWGSETGAECNAQVEFYTYNEAGGEPMSRDWPNEIQVATRDAANAFAVSFDFDGVDRDEAVKVFRAEEKKIIEGEPDPSERQPYASDEQAELNGVLDIFFDEVRAHLAEKDLPMETIIDVTGWECES